MFIHIILLFPTCCLTGFVSRYFPLAVAAWVFPPLFFFPFFPFKFLPCCVPVTGSVTSYSLVRDYCKEIYLHSLNFLWTNGQTVPLRFLLRDGLEIGSVVSSSLAVGYFKETHCPTVFLFLFLNLLRVANGLTVGGRVGRRGGRGLGGAPRGRPPKLLFVDERIADKKFHVIHHMHHTNATIHNWRLLHRSSWYRSASISESYDRDQMNSDVNCIVQKR